MGMTDPVCPLLARVRTAVLPKVLAASVTASLALAATASAPMAAPEASARRALDRCVSTVLKQLARRRVAESRIGLAVASRCDRQLRATLADSIRSGEAAGCTVDSCIDMARAQAAERARQIYRQHIRR